MARKNFLLQSPPHAVEQSIKRLGSHIRLARLRRNMTIQQMADKIGTGVKSVMDAEKGKPSTSMAVYIAILWALDLIDQLQDVAAPAKDQEGMTLSIHKERQRARQKDILDNDF